MTLAGAVEVVSARQDVGVEEIGMQAQTDLTVQIAAQKRPRIRQIAAYCEQAGQRLYDSGMSGRDAMTTAFTLAVRYADRYHRDPDKTLIRLLVNLGWVDPIIGCRCQLCRSGKP